MTDNAQQNRDQKLQNDRYSAQPNKDLNSNLRPGQANAPRKDAGNAESNPMKKSADRNQDPRRDKDLPRADAE